MELRGYILKPAPNPKYFGYPNPQIRGRRSKPEPETRKPETRGYPPRTHPTAILNQDQLHCTRGQFHYGTVRNTDFCKKIVGVRLAAASPLHTFYYNLQDRIAHTSVLSIVDYKSW